MIKKIFAIAFLSASAVLRLYAQNPVVQTSFTPDPAPLVYKDRVLYD
jgi:arabinoxylan arabinofuranohydrolase